MSDFCDKVVIINEQPQEEQQMEELSSYYIFCHDSHSFVEFESNVHHSNISPVNTRKGFHESSNTDTVDKENDNGHNNNTSKSQSIPPMTITSQPRPDAEAAPMGQLLLDVEDSSSFLSITPSSLLVSNLPDDSVNPLVHQFYASKKGDHCHINNEKDHKTTTENTDNEKYTVNKNHVLPCYFAPSTGTMTVVKDSSSSALVVPPLLPVSNDPHTSIAKQTRQSNTSGNPVDDPLQFPRPRRLGSLDNMNISSTPVADMNNRNHFGTRRTRRRMRRANRGSLSTIWEDDIDGSADDNTEEYNDETRHEEQLYPDVVRLHGDLMNTDGTKDDEYTIRRHPRLTPLSKTVVFESSGLQTVVSVDQHMVASPLPPSSSSSSDYSVPLVQAAQSSPSTVMMVKPIAKSILKHPTPLDLGKHRSPSIPHHGTHNRRPKKQASPRQTVHQDPRKPNRWFFKLLTGRPTSCIRTS
jgi:hypothetical protein